MPDDAPRSRAARRAAEQALVRVVHLVHEPADLLRLLAVRRSSRSALRGVPWLGAVSFYQRSNIDWI
jgi:hypothetical protein